MVEPRRIDNRPVAGASYITVDTLGSGQFPILSMIADPLDLVDQFPDPAIGVSMHPYDDRDMIITIDPSLYPDPVYWLTEVAQFGVCERIGPYINYARITPQSTLHVVHPRGYIRNYADYYEAVVGERRAQESSDHIGLIVGPTLATCPRDNPQHNAWLSGDPQYRPTSCCSGFWWQDFNLDDRNVGPIPNPDLPRRSVIRYMSNTGQKNHGQRRPDGVDPVYAPAVIARITGLSITVVRDPMGWFEMAVPMAQRSQLQVKVRER